MYNILLSTRKKRLKKVDKFLLTMIRITMYLWKLCVPHWAYIFEINEEIFNNAYNFIQISILCKFSFSIIFFFFYLFMQNIIVIILTHKLLQNFRKILFSCLHFMSCHSLTYTTRFVKILGFFFCYYTKIKNPKPIIIYWFLSFEYLW